MAIVPQPKDIKVRNLLAYIEDNIHEANRDLKDELDDSGRLDAAFKSGRDTSAKDHIINVIRASKWLSTELVITGNQGAFTDTEIKALNREIIEFEDDT